jgi:cell division transport system permease protein
MSAANPIRSSAGRISSFSTVVGITMVLTMVGVLIALLIVGGAVTRHFREQLTVQVMLKENAPEQEVLKLQRTLEGRPFAGTVSYTSKEDAAEMMQQELGEEFVDFLGYNPLPASLDIKINPDFGALDSLSIYVAEIAASPHVQEVVYHQNLLQQINENITRWGLVLLAVGALFLIIAIVLIVNTIELSIFSQRFIIRSMQLVGATHWFIQRPFLRKGLGYGLTGAICALAIISLCLFLFRDDLTDVIDILIAGNRYLLLAGGVLIAGLLVSWLATAYAVRRFIRLRLDQLH